MNKVLGERYELISKIGGGGMAEVYKARCRMLNRFVAIKVLRNEFSSDEDFIRRFKVEAQAAASLSHPNIVSIYDVGEDNNVHYIVMEYIDGQPLKDYIGNNGIYNWKSAVLIAKQILEGISHAHKNRIVHRDIKPHNIIVTKDGSIKVTDFGIARAAASTTITMAGSTIGSVHYFSPEQARGVHTDERSDIYSTGVTLYEMLTGKLPFDGETPIAVALKHIQENPVSPRELDPDLPAALAGIVMKALEKNPDARYQTADEMLEHLKLVLANPKVKINFSEGQVSQETIKVDTLGTLSGIGRDGRVFTNTNKNGKEQSIDMKNEKKKKIIIMSAITSLVILAIAVAVIVILPSIAPPVPEFIVEDYTNLDFQEVKTKLEAEGITVTINLVNSDEVSKDFIVAQSVKKGQKLKEGGFNKIEFDVSKGPEMLIIPDVRNKESRIAEISLKEAGFKPVIFEEYSDTIAEGLVTRTSPDIETEAKPDSEVIVYVSKGPEILQVIVPDLTGMTLDQARLSLENAGLTIGKLEPEGISSETAKIKSQNPSPNTMLDQGKPVNLVFEETIDISGDTTGNNTDNSNENVDNSGTDNQNTESTQDGDGVGTM